MSEFYLLVTLYILKCSSVVYKWDSIVCRLRFFCKVSRFCVPAIHFYLYYRRRYDFLLYWWIDGLQSTLYSYIFCNPRAECCMQRTLIRSELVVVVETRQRDCENGNYKVADITFQSKCFRLYL